MNDKNDLKENEDKKERGNGEEEIKKDLDDILGQIKESEKEKQKESPEKERESTLQSQKKIPEESGEEGLEQILDKISEKEEAPEEELNVFQRVLGIFTNPVKVFQHLKFKPDYLTPIIITVIISILASLLVYDIALDDQIANVEQNEKLTDDQRDNIIDQVESSREGVKRIIYTTVIPLVSTILLFVIIAGIFLLIGNVFLGGKARFVQILSAYAYSYLIMALAGSAVKLPLWLSRQTLKVDTSLAIFLPQSMEGSTLYRVISSSDVFTLWFLIVFALGFSVIYRFSQLKGILTVFIAWLIYVVITKVVLGSIFATFTG